MREEKRLVPKRRIMGAVGDWTESKLEELSFFSKGRGYSKKDLRDSGHPLILYGRLYTNYETIINNVDTYAVKQENSVISKGGEVVVPSSGETKEDIARASVIAKANIILGGDLNIINTTNEIDPAFLALSISNGTPQKELIKRAQGSSVVHIYNEDLMNITLYYPQIKEQKIGEFFKVLDERIANQEQKIAKVKTLKSAYLTEMFPQEGETVPKRRFKGFEGEWERYLFSSILKTHQFKPYLSKPKKDGKYEVIQQGDTPVVGYSNAIPFKNYKNVVLFGDHTLSLFKPIKPFLIATDGVKILEVEKVPSEFLFVLLKKYLPKSEGYKRHFSILQNQYCYIPNKLQEQQNIGQFFKNLDDQIATEEKKLEKLKQMKEAYLEEMFV